MKLRLLAEVVELVMRTHHSLADNKASVNSNHGSPSTTSGSNDAQGSAAVAQRRASNGTAGGGSGRGSTKGSGGGGGGGLTSGGNSGPPWGAPIPGPPHLPRSGPLDDRGGAVMGNINGGGGGSHGYVHVVPHSPPAAHGPRHQHPSMPLDGAFLGGGCGGNVSRMGGGSGSLLISSGGGGGSGHHDRYQPQYISSSLTGFNDDLNPPPPLRLSRNAPGSCPGPTSAHTSSSTYAAVPRARSSWNAGDPRQHQHQHQHKGTVTGGDWVRGPGPWGGGEDSRSVSRLLPGSLPSTFGAPGEPHSSPSLPIGPPHPHSQQSHLQQLQQQLVMDEGSATAAVEPVSGGGGGGGGGQQSDWAAVQKAFGAPSSLHLPLPPPTMVPSSPHSGSPAPKLPSLPSSSSSSAVVTSASTPLETSMAGSMSKYDGFGYGAGIGGGGGGDTATEGTAVDSDVSGEGGSEHSSSSVGGGGRGGAGCFVGGLDGAGDDAVLSSLSAAMTRTQIQIEAMLERQSRALDERMGGIETMLSARLSLLEGKIQGLENHRPSQQQPVDST